MIPLPAARACVASAALLVLWVAAIAGAPAVPRQSARTAPAAATADDRGKTLFEAQCGFCHGRDAMGGPTGPDLTDSDLVAQDKNGDKIGPVVRSGRIDKGMPPSGMPESDLRAVVAFIHAQKKKSDAQPGRRRKVTVADLQTGNAEAGRRYFEGPGGCTRCHSATGDLAGLSNRYRGLALVQRMLYPTSTNALPLAPGEKAKPNPVKVTVTLPTGQTVTGSLAYRDEFTIGLKDASGWYRAWPAGAVKFTVDDPMQAHADQLGKYTDDDIHNLVAYLQILR